MFYLGIDQHSKQLTVNLRNDVIRRVKTSIRSAGLTSAVVKVVGG